ARQSRREQHEQEGVPMLPTTRNRLSIMMLQAALLSLTVAGARAQTPGKEEAHNMRLVGHNDLQARSAYHPEIHRQGDRWIAYVGHHGGMAENPITGRQESNGTSVVDVTDPANPRYIAHIPGEEGEGERGGAQMVRWCSGADLPGADDEKFYILRSFGNSGHEI